MSRTDNWPDKPGILFVCMGNICRSPSAEGFFRAHAERLGLQRKLHVDSAGTHSYHLGNPPDERAIHEAARFNVDISGLRARQVCAADFDRFQHIVAMDRDNFSLLKRQAPAHATAQLSLMMSFDPEAGVAEVPDPYYGTQKDFTYMCELLDRATAGLLAHVRQGLDGG